MKIEPLESRLLAATAAFWFDAPPQVVVGRPFAVEIWCAEYDPHFAGLAGVSLNVEHARLTLLDWDVTDHLPLFQSAELREGELTNLRGAALLSGGAGRPIGNWDPERFATLTFVVDSPGEYELSAEQGRSRVAPAPVASLSSKHLRFDPATVEAVEPSIHEQVLELLHEERYHDAAVALAECRDAGGMRGEA